ncbi:AP2-containing protein [Hordeum vulgare]|nr:AP2-containing protein [Hordeum vulgare]
MPPPRVVRLCPVRHATARSPLGRRPLPDGTEEDVEGQAWFLRREGKALRELRSKVLRRRAALVWLGTYPTADEAAHAYDVAVWRAGRPKTDLKFPEV